MNLDKLAQMIVVRNHAQLRVEGICLGSGEVNLKRDKLLNLIKVLDSMIDRGMEADPAVLFERK